jgi:4a-hydroxytetrahydrobiopterin dehydratase
VKSLIEFIPAELLVENDQNYSVLNSIVGNFQPSSDLPVQPIKKSEWVIIQQPERLARQFEFDKFKVMKVFLDTLLNYQEKIHHHSTITIGHRTIDIEVYTHDINEVTNRDKELAKFIDTLYEDVQYHFLPKKKSDDNE